MKHCIMSLGVLLALSLSAADNVLPMKVEKWKHYDAQSEQMKNGIRTRIPTNKSGYGKFGAYVPKSSPNHYIQVYIENMESAAAAPWVSNCSSNGGDIGKVFTGLNTIKMPAHTWKGSFFLAVAQLGDRKQETGPWVDYNEIRFTETPQNAPVVTLQSGDTVKVGSVLNIKLTTKEMLANPPSVEFIIIPKFIPYRFCKDSKITLKKNADGSYSGSLTVTKDALVFSSNSSVTKNLKIAAQTNLNGMVSYYTLPFTFDVQTANEPSWDPNTASSLQVYKNRQLWKDLTKGTNLALNRTLQLVPKPDYNLTSDANDPKDLTNGRLANRADDRIWFNKDAVGWYFSNNNYIKIDLGSVQPVERVVIRLIGGTTGNFKFPHCLTVYASKDDKEYFRTASMQKLAPGERNQADWVHYYYLDENGVGAHTQMYPFALNVRGDARYLILNVEGETGATFSDELVCLKAENKGADYNSFYKEKSVAVPMSGLIVRPRVQELAVMRGLPAPQEFMISDLRTAAEKNDPAEMVLELPEGLKIIKMYGSKNMREEAMPGKGTRYIVDLGKKVQKVSPTFFVGVTGKVTGKAVIYGRSKGVDQFRTELPLVIVDPPAITPFKRLQISLSWLGEGETDVWPDFLNNFARLGFNQFTVFPRYWWNEKAVQTGQTRVANARKAGFKIITNMSPMHVMWNVVKQPGHEVCCQIPDKPTKMLCPTYRGEFYKKEMERIRNLVRISKPDIVYFDIEAWTSAFGTAPVCTRCKEAWKKSGKSLSEYLYDCGDEISADLRNAVTMGAKDAGIPVPPIGSYDRKPMSKTYCIERWNTTYPRYINMAQPSLYVVGRAKSVHESVLGNHKLLGNKNLIPFLSTGCYGEFESYKVEQMVLESLLNGACGITYFSGGNFKDSPLDYYYHLKALAEIRPYEDLIMDGKVCDVANKEKDKLCSMTRKDNELLLLVGNYDKNPEKTTVELPFAPETVKDLRSGKTLKTGKNFSFQVPKGDIRLFYIAK